MIDAGSSSSSSFKVSAKVHVSIEPPRGSADDEAFSGRITVAPASGGGGNGGSATTGGGGRRHRLGESYSGQSHLVPWPHSPLNPRDSRAVGRWGESFVYQLLLQQVSSVVAHWPRAYIAIAITIAISFAIAIATRVIQAGTPPPRPPGRAQFSLLVCYTPPIPPTPTTNPPLSFSVPTRERLHCHLAQPRGRDPRAIRPQGRAWHINGSNLKFDQHYYFFGQLTM